MKTRATRVKPAAALLGLALTAASSSAAQAEEGFDYASYAAALGAYVDGQGLVDYKAFKANRKDLDAFVLQLQALQPAQYEGWDNSSQIAFWINAYNGLTLTAVLDNYPIQSSFFSSLLYPKNSIRQIDGVWTELKFKVMGREVTLDWIEHETLRKKFQEPRIHMALVCAALSCPPLRNEPYRGDRLESQLEDQTRRFLRREANFKAARSSRGKGTVSLSSIFDWFAKDFVSRYGGDPAFSARGAEVGAVLNFILPHVPEPDQQYLKSGSYSVRYTDYDWTLNERP